MNFEKFCTLLGHTIAYFQLIENDIKLIYAAMSEGPVEQTMERIDREKWTMGQAVMELQELDYSDGMRYISNDDYYFLRQLTGKRNHWCHESVLTLVDKPNFVSSKEFYDEYNRLVKDNQRLQLISHNLEAVRRKAMADFKKNKR